VTLHRPVGDGPGAVALRDRHFGAPGRAAAVARWSRRTSRPRPIPSAVPVDWITISLTGLAVVLMNTIPPTLLTHLKIHYVTTGGGVYEKFHPGTYAFILAFFLTLFRDGAPVRELDRMISDAKLILLYVFSIIVLLIQSIVLGRPVTGAVDTFVLPIIAFFVIGSLSPGQKKPLVWTIHLLMLVNIALGYFEFLSGHRLIPITVGDVVLTDEWRSTALLGHPLTASGLVGTYTLALILRPSLCPSLVLRVPLILLCLGSLFVFGGRTALVLVLLGIALLAAWTGIGFVRGARIRLPLVIAGICAAFLVAAGVFALFDIGFLDKMLLRFSADKGSALARVASIHLLLSLDTRELLLGADPARIDALQSFLGIQVGIEDFWIACIAQYGLIATVLLTLGLACYFTEVIWRSHPAARAIAVFLIVIAASSVSFSSKGVKLTQHLTLILLLLSRDRVTRAAPARPSFATAAARLAPRRA
jgi:hypothetical protein